MGQGNTSEFVEQASSWPLFGSRWGTELLIPDGPVTNGGFAT